jgi:predicted transcriptional regulator
LKYFNESEYTDVYRTQSIKLYNTAANTIILPKRQFLGMATATGYRALIELRKELGLNFESVEKKLQSLEITGLKNIEEVTAPLQNFIKTFDDYSDVINTFEN